MAKHSAFIALFTPTTEGGYTVEFPHLQGCVSQGDTFEQAVDNAREALALWLEAAEPNVRLAAEDLSRSVAPANPVVVRIPLDPHINIFDLY